MSYSRHQLIALLRKHGIAPTHQRLEIANVLFSRCEHLAADQILALVNERHAETSKATVYNTLNLFSAKGLLKPLQVDPQRGLFDSNTEPHHHIHDVDTGELIDVPPGDVEFARLPPLPPGTEAVGVDVVIRVRRRGA